MIAIIKLIIIIIIVYLTSEYKEIQRERKKWELPRTKAGVETDLEITWSNYDVNHNHNNIDVKYMK